MKRWLMIQNIVALNTIFKKRPDKQTTCRSSLGKEKQLDHIIADRRSMRHCRDAEANDMIDVGSDHGSDLGYYRLTGAK